MIRVRPSMIRPAVAALAVASAAFDAVPAAARSATTTLPVRATVVDGCSVVASPMIFVIPSASAVVNTDATSQITMACTPGAVYDVALDGGLYPTGSARRMYNATAAKYLRYDIYRNAPRTAEWGARPGRDTVSGTATGTGRVNLVAYGRVRTNPSIVTAGSYADSVTVTVNF